MKLELRGVATGMLAVTLGLGSINSVRAQAASDVAGHWAEKKIAEWVTNGYLKGYADGTIKPNNPITRAEFIALVNGLFELTEFSTIAFKDLSPTNWAHTEMAKAVKAGYIPGYNDKIRPINNITRQEAAIMIAKIVGLSMEEQDDKVLSKFTDEETIADWSRQSVASIVQSYNMKGYTDGRFAPVEVLTRAEAVVLISAAFTAKAELDPATEESFIVPTSSNGESSREEAGSISGDVSLEVTPTPEVKEAVFIKQVYVFDSNNDGVLSKYDTIMITFDKELTEDSRELIIHELESRTMFLGAGMQLIWQTDNQRLMIQLGNRPTAAYGSAFFIPKQIIVGVDGNSPQSDIVVQLDKPLNYGVKAEIESARQLENITSIRVRFYDELSVETTERTQVRELIGELVKFRGSDSFVDRTIIEVKSVQWDETKRVLILYFDEQSFTAAEKVSITFVKDAVRKHSGLGLPLIRLGTSGAWAC